MFTLGYENAVWALPVATGSRYPVGHAENDYDITSWAGCYMQRRSNSYQANFTLKNAIEYEVTVGYNVYEGSYNI